MRYFKTLIRNNMERMILWLNSSAFSGIIWIHGSGSILIQITACCLFSTEPLPETILTYCQLDPKEQTSLNFKSKCNDFNSRKFYWKYYFQNGGHFVSASMCWWLSCVRHSLGCSPVLQLWWQGWFAVLRDCLIHGTKLLQTHKHNVNSSEYEQESYCECVQPMRDDVTL